MKTHFIPLYIGIISMVFFHNPCLGDSLTLAHGIEFSLLDERSVDSSPSVLVTFPDGYMDRLVLNKNTFNDGDRIEIDDGCNYVGHLAIEKDACVAMTGCFGSDDIELTIMSSHAVGSTGFLWTKEGVIHAVDVNEKFQNDVAKIRATNYDDDYSEEYFNDFDTDDSENRESNDNSFEKFFDGTYTEGSKYQVNHEDEKKASSRSIPDDMCYYLRTPPTAIYNIKAMYSDAWFEMFDRNTTAITNRLKSVFAHVRASFCHPSLGTKVHINLQNPNNPIHLTEKHPGKTVQETIEADPTTHLVTYFLRKSGGGGAATWTPCHPNKSKHFIKSLCGKPGLYSGAIGCANIVRHELGHSLGMGHTYTENYPPDWDCGPRGSIMSGNDKVNWNPCGVMDFRRMYTIFSDNWCLPKYEKACSLETEAEDKDISYFQIRGESGIVLDLPAPAANSLMFSKNGLKDSQFWYLSNQANSDYGYIGSKKHFDNRKVLTISLGDNADMLDATIIRLKSDQGDYLAVNETDKNQLYFTTEDSSNSRWQFIAHSDNVTIQLKNVYSTKSKRFLKQNKKGNSITTSDKGAGINWIVHVDAYSNQISLESNKGDFLIRKDDTVTSFKFEEFDPQSVDPGAIWTVEIVPLCGQSGCKVVLENPTRMNKQFQMWKLNGTSLVSQFNNAVIGVNDESILSAYVGGEEDPVSGAVTIDKVAKSNYTSPMKECPYEPEEFLSGQFHIMNTMGNLSTDLSFEESDSSWILEPQGGSDVKFWGFIHGKNGYLTAHDCGKKGKGCKIAVKEFHGFNNQLWRTMNGKIINKLPRGRASKPAVLTVDSDGTVVAMDPNIDENQSWTLVKSNEE